MPREIENNDDNDEDFEYTRDMTFLEEYIFHLYAIIFIFCILLALYEKHL